VNDLLDLSRVAAGKIVLKKHVIDIRNVIFEAVRAAQPLAERHKLRLTFINCADPLYVEADPVRVDQIVTNILTNAIKYTPEGGHVKVALLSDGDHALIQVTDDGVGIAADRIGGIFELFAQAENAIGRAQGGMGIGLALVRNLVQLHGGAVSAKSDGIGKGSEFAVRLPIAHEPAQDAPPVEEQQHDGDSSPRRIVIVEDNADVRHLLQLKLSRLGHHVYEAADGLEGLRVLLNERPDLALVDLGLPGIDGFQLAKEVREQLGHEVVLVAVSGFGRPEDKRCALDAGFDEHVTKPADVRDIERILQRFPPRPVQK
jgi:CheY-like chemotaxis protein